VNGDAPAWVTTTTLLRGLHDYDNREAWDRLVERFRRPIETFVRQVGVAPADREDVAQEALVAFAQEYRRGSYDPSRGRLRQWLFGIAYRQALQQRRRSQRQTPPGGVEAPRTAIPDESAAHGLWDRVWDQYLLEKSVEVARTEFSPTTFAAFERTVLRDETPQEAADHLGIPTKAVYNGKHRVLQRVRALIDELGDIHPG